MSSVLHVPHYDVDKQALVEPFTYLEMETSTTNPRSDLSLWVNAVGPTLMLGGAPITSGGGTVVGSASAATGDTSSIVKIDSSGNLFSSKIARPTACKLSYGFSELNTYALTTSYLTVFTNGGNYKNVHTISGVPVFSFPLDGVIRFDGLSVGDVTPRTFRVTYNLNHGTTTTPVFFTLGINGTADSLTGLYKVQTAAGSISQSFLLDGQITLTPGQYVSVLASGAVPGTLDVHKSSLFIELLK
jgi:hypothetical protein